MGLFENKMSNCCDPVGKQFREYDACCGSKRYMLNEVLTHWGRVTHICVSDLTSIGSDNGLSPGRRQAIIRTNAGILLIGPLGRNFNEILIEIHTFSFKKMHLKMSSAKWRPFCLGLIGVRTKWPSFRGCIFFRCVFTRDDVWIFFNLHRRLTWSVS